MSEPFELGGEAPGGSGGVAAAVVVAAGVVVDLAGLEHVPGSGEHRMSDRGISCVRSCSHEAQPECHPVPPKRENPRAYRVAITDGNT